MLVVYLDPRLNTSLPVIHERPGTEHSLERLRRPADQAVEVTADEFGASLRWSTATTTTRTRKTRSQ
jgi:hypothetical protein